MFFSTLSAAGNLLAQKVHVPFFSAVEAHPWSYVQWRLQAYSPQRISIPHPEKFTVILLSYKRIRNMEPIVRTVLRCNFVKKVILSNNNPRYAIEDWVRIASDRLFLINQPQETGCAFRYDLARQEDTEYFMVLDDDIFLFPEQLATLAMRTLENPTVPHGIFGQIATDLNVDNPMQAFCHCITGEREVDCLGRVLAFTKTHVERYFSLLEALNIRGAAALHALRMGDDVVMSFSGQGKPQCHDVGIVLNCASQGQKGIATWQENGFFDYRRTLFCALAQLQHAHV